MHRLFAEFPTNKAFVIQMVWLPRALGIDQHIVDHDWHHHSFNSNYGKRFLLWDKLYGTHGTPPELQYADDKKSE